MQGWMKERHLSLDAEDFMDSYEACSEWIQGRLRLFAQGIKGNKELEDAVHSSMDMSLSHLLDASGGLVKIPHFFPQDVAEKMRDMVKQVPDGGWVETQGALDATGINIDHHFYSNKTEKLQDLFRIIGLLMPDREFWTFSAGRYEEGDYIARHDDGAYVKVKADEGVLECSRDVAIVLYLTPGWTHDMGGAFADHVGGQTYTPEFNSLVAFRVPRLHEVTKVTSKARKAGLSRASLFGWFLLPGRQYPLTSRLAEEVVDAPDFDADADEKSDVAPVSRKLRAKHRGQAKSAGRDRKSAQMAMEY